MVFTYLSAKSFMKTLGFRRHHKFEYLMTTISLYLKKKNIFMLKKLPPSFDRSPIECAASLIGDALIISKKYSYM